MKVLMVNGSPRRNGNTARALKEVADALAKEGVESEVVGKPAACIAVCRRGGSTAAFQAMNMPFEMLNCPVVTSQYWNIAYGRAEGECGADAEGMQTMRTMARNMAWLLKSVKDNPPPAREPWQMTSFIR